MDCIIHYDGYTDATESLIPLSKDKFDQLKVAANARHELGGEYVSSHSKQIRNIPDEFKDGCHVHWTCYKKIVFSINKLKEKQTSGEESSGNRAKRTGDLKQTNLPNHCQFCKKSGKKCIKGSSKKQPVRKIELISAEENIREAAELKDDESMLVLTRSIESLRAAEFKMHEKCFKDYTRIVHPKRPRTKATEAYTTPEDREMVGGYAMRKRSKVEYNDNVVDEDKGDSEMVVDESLDEQNFNIVPEIEVGQNPRLRRRLYIM